MMPTPVAPVAPVGPAGPVEPVAPVGPVTPMGPCGQSVPAVRSDPVGPVIPVGQGQGGGQGGTGGGQGGMGGGQGGTGGRQLQIRSSGKIGFKNRLLAIDEASKTNRAVAHTSICRPAASGAGRRRRGRRGRMKNGCKKGPGRRRRPGLTFNFSGSRQMGKNSPSGLSKQSADRPPHFRRPGSAVQVGGNGGLIVQHGLRCFLDFPRGLDGLPGRVSFRRARRASSART